MALLENYSIYLDRFYRDSLTEAKQDELNFQNKFGDKLTQRFLAVRNKLSSPENDYYYWIKNKSEDELNKYLTTIEDTKSKTQQKQELKQEGAELVYDKDGWKVYKILTYDASKFYGKGTKWCISGNYNGAESRGKHYFDDYKKKGVKDYYFIISPDDNKWCYLDYGGKLNDEQFFNASDTGIYVSDTEVDPMFFTIPLEIFDILPNINREYINSVKDKLEFNTQLDKCFEYNGNSLIVKAEYESLSPRLKRKMIREFIRTMRAKLHSLTIEEGVETITERMFFGFISLETVTLPSSVKVIEECAFSFTGIKEIDLSSVEVIEDNAFSPCNLNQVTLNPNTKYLGDCFENDGVNIDFYIKGKELNKTLQQGLSHVSKDKIHLI